MKRSKLLCLVVLALLPAIFWMNGSDSKAQGRSRSRSKLPGTISKPQEQYYRLQLKHGGQFLDADHCSTTISLNPGSDYEGGACELWRLVPNGDGWNRLQLKHGGQFLDADHCST
ncbi:MAG: RICIN domain-containing protein, partial [Aulosira sp. ZfuVER01]|nr:RICIN domain-containing protein [Aulosira sp. ZfuVER01]